MKCYYHCQANDCFRFIEFNTAQGSHFCALHYQKWANEILAAGGTQRETEAKPAPICAKCKDPQPCELEANGRCYDCCMTERDVLSKPSKAQPSDPVDHPSHYTEHPSGIECITITEHMGFCLGNAMKYIWRADGKGGIEDLEKARWYITREIEKQKKGVIRGTK